MMVLFLAALFLVPPILEAQTPPPVEKRYHAALQALGRDRPEQAAIDLRQIIIQFPDFTPAYGTFFEVSLQLKSIDSAAAFFSERLQQNPENAYALYGLARIDLRKKDYDGAIARLKKSIALDPGFAEALSHYDGLPEVYRRIGDLDSAIAFCKSLIEQNPQNSRAYYGLARSYIRNNNWAEGLANLKQAIRLDPDFVFAYREMVFTYNRMTRLDSVLIAGRLLAEKASQQNYPELAAYAKMMMGSVYIRRSDILNALSHLDKALQDAREIGATKRAAACINNIAFIYANSGKLDQAHGSFLEALRLSRILGARSKESIYLANLGNTLKDQERYDEALSYYDEALTLARQLKEPIRESHVRANMAELYQLAGEIDRAEEILDVALELAVETEDKTREGFIYRTFGRLYEASNRHDEAIAAYQRSLKLGIDAREVEGLWESLAGLGSVFASLGQIDQAIEHYERAIAQYDSVRAGLDIASLATHFLEDKYESYSAIISLLGKKGRHHEAFKYAEKYKAKNILDVLAQDNDRFAGLAGDSLVSRSRQLTAEMMSLHAQLSAEMAGQQNNNEQIQLLKQQVAELQIKKTLAVSKLKRQYQEQYRAAAPTIRSVPQIQTLLQNDRQGLIQYVIGPDEISVFVVTPDTLVFSAIPLARKQLLSMMTRLSPLFARSQTQQDNEEIFNNKLANFQIPPAMALYDALVKPFEPWLADLEDLIIVPDDFLYYLPFEMLVTDAAKARTPYDFSRSRFLMEDYAITYSPSASSLADGQDLGSTQTTLGILALGNPEFDESAKQDFAYEVQTANLSFASGLLRNNTLVPLPNAENEVREIGRAFRGAENRIYVGTEATESNFRRNASEYSVLHFATHFLANDNFPLYSKIALAKDADSQSDGYLQAYEIFDMDLNAELVVLSACNTGLGQLRRGEGLIGIAKAFEGAGVPSMVTSLWSVDDRATSIIMSNFYENLRDGQSKDRALRAAKLRYLKEAPNQQKDPFFWAPFVLVGNNQPLDLPQSAPFPGTGLIILAVLALLLLPYLITRHISARSQA